ncbi:MAG: PilZ domain-containing protein [Bdellovibrionales bacterium]|nr:PilZ domain-containing protein [Bdellovibrionales bacterium]
MTKKKVVESLTEEQKRIMQKASPALNRQVGGDFTKIDSSERKQLLLRAAPHARQPSMLWTKDRKLTKKFYVRRYLEFHGQLECEFADRASRVLGEVDQELDIAGTNDIYFNMRCEESTVFFHLNRRAISSRNGLLLVRVPSDLYEIQRRAQLRYRSNGGDGFRIESEVFSLWLEDLSILDVSSGGIGVQVRFKTDAEADAFKLAEDSRLHFHLDLKVFSFLAQGEVRYLRKATDDETGQPVVRIGIRFVGLPQETVEAIQILVLERSYSRLREMFTD